jgi:23S rRNA (uracil1939-C5)-methyltransferase
VGQTIELALDGIAHGGEAIGRHAGKVIFVPYAIPGERVRVEIVEEKERWARARLVEVIEPSSDRLEPPCPYFGPDKCGGCQWQHIAYERQAELKAEIVADQLRRLGRIDKPTVADPLVLADDEGYLDYGYRNHTEFAVTPEGQLAYRRAFSHDLISIERCLLLDDRLDDLHHSLDVAWPALRSVELRVGRNADEVLVVFETSGDEEPELELDLPASFVMKGRKGVLPLIGQPWVTEEVAGRQYRVSAESFFQVNTVGAEALVDWVTRFADVGATDVVLDAYCGVGLFTLPLAERVAEVIGIESSPSACEDLAFNAEDRTNITLHEGPVEEVLPALVAQMQHVNVAVLDPPRAGAGPAVIKDLAAMGPRRIVYVSCDPATLARDSVALAEAGYELSEAQPVDMFPQTFHIETVALFIHMAA